MYVNAFTLISRQVDPLLREFSLAAASLGDSLGIAFADIAGILIQVSNLSWHTALLLYHDPCCSPPLNMMRSHALALFTNSGVLGLSGRYIC